MAMQPMLTFEVAGEVQLRRAFSRFGDGVTDLRAPFTGIADDFEKMSERIFASEGSTGGRGQWAPLTQAYAARKAKIAPGKSILRLTDRLWRSLTGRNSADAIRSIKKDELRLGSKVPYGLYHQDARSPRTKRRPIDLAERDKRRWGKIVQRHLVDIAKREGILKPTAGSFARGGARGILG